MWAPPFVAERLRCDVPPDDELEKGRREEVRAGTQYRCPECGEDYEHPVRCFRCSVPALDENGNEPPPTFVRLVMQPAKYRWRPGLPDGNVDVGWLGPLIDRIAKDFAEGRELKRRLKFFKRTPMGQGERFGQAWWKLSGRVRIIEPVSFDGEHDLACYRVRKHTYDETGPDVITRGKAVETHQGCGRFLIVGEETQVFVDDDFFQLIPPPGRSHGVNRVWLREGDWVLASGPVLTRPAAELGLTGQVDASGTDYRSAGQVLCFEGTSENLVMLQPFRK